MLTVYHSNRLENLFRDLTGVLDRPRSSLLTPEVVLVQSQGMARWLSLEIAGHYGICANLNCPFPASFIWHLFEKIKGSTGRSPYEKECFVWSIMAQLDCLIDDPDFQVLKGYLAIDGLPMRRYQLACRIAGLFEQYMVFRPDWTRKWRNNVLTTAQQDSEVWQAKLWRQLEKAYGQGHRAALLYEFMQQLNGDLIKELDLPERISVFGIPSLPVTQLAVFERLAEFIDVHLFLLNPCSAFWDEIVSRRQLARISLENIASLPATETYYETGCELLASLGGVGRDFQRLIHSYDFQEVHSFEEPTQETLLAVLQSDIIHAAGPDSRTGPLRLDANDRSIRIHSAHSRRREVEILHDQLLDIFNQHSDERIDPGDVLVMAPDISQYEPYIEAVFGSPQESAIPFAIADLSMAAESEVFRLFMELLRLALSRVTARQVHELLDSAVFKQNFGLSRDDVERIGKWLRDTSVSWGVDKEHRHRFTGGTSHGTLKDCVRRLLLGYALPGDGRRMFEDVLPYDQVEGNDADMMEKFMAITSSLTSLIIEAATERTLAGWRIFLLDVLDRFIPEHDDLQADKQYIRGCLDELGQAERLSGFSRHICLEVVIAHLDRRLQEKRHGSGFLSGKVTFCRMETTRSVPFKIICLLGMNDGEYPRVENRVGFDLLANDHRLGDRQRRDEDRYFFLETLLSARQILYISYIGKSSRENQKLPPSVLVTELVEYIAETLRMELDAAEERIVTSHPLQPFSRFYFQDRELFSYSASHQRVSVNLAGEKLPYQGIFKGCALPEPDCGTAGIDEFIRFFEHPVRFLLKERSGIVLYDRVEEFRERETFSLDGLQRYTINTLLVETEMAGEPVEQLERVFQARDMVPPGKFGTFLFRQQASEAKDFAGRIREWRSSAEKPSEEGTVHVDIGAGSLRLVGRLKVLAGLQLFYRPAKGDSLNHRDSIRHWISHLLFCAADRSVEEKRTVFVCKDSAFVYETVEDPQRYLAELVNLYLLGMRRPLFLLPRTSYVFALNLWGRKRKAKGLSLIDECLLKAETSWYEGSYQQGAERDDIYMRAALGDYNPVRDAAFQDIAETVLRPAVELRKRIMN